jgi:hypothetical protein
VSALKLRAVKHAKGDRNRFCGPSVLSSVTGMSTGEAARLLRSVSGRSSIKGTSTTQMAMAFGQCRINMRIHKEFGRKNPERPTLAAWLRDSSGTRGGRVFLVSAGDHWQLVSGNRYVCGIVGDVVALTDPRVKRRARVRAVYELVAQPNSVIIPVKALKPEPTPAARAAASKMSSARVRAKKLAVEIGCEIERHNDLDSKPWWVDHPELTDEADPHDGDHYVHSWEEVLERVESYAEALAATK